MDSVIHLSNNPSNISTVNLDKRLLHLTSGQDLGAVVMPTGSSLAQDRGRMEARIEALTAEVSELKKECQVRLPQDVTNIISHRTR